jgi:hypothetical protein
VRGGRGAGGEARGGDVPVARQFPRGRCRQDAAQVRGEEGLREQAGVVYAAGGRLPRRPAEVAPAGADREQPVVRQVGRERERVVLVLPARVDGLHRAVRPDEVQGGGEIAFDGVQEVGAAEHVGQQQQRRVGHMGRVVGAPFRVQALRVDVDALGEPLLDTVEQPAVGERPVQAGQRRAQLPAVVRGVHPTGQEAFAGGAGDLGERGRDVTQFRPGARGEDVRVAHVVDGERGVRR